MSFMEKLFGKKEAKHSGYQYLLEGEQKITNLIGGWKIGEKCGGFVLYFQLGPLTFPNPLTKGEIVDYRGTTGRVSEITQHPILSDGRCCQNYELDRTPHRPVGGRTICNLTDVKIPWFIRDLENAVNKSIYASTDFSTEDFHKIRSDKLSDFQSVKRSLVDCLVGNSNIKMQITGKWNDVLRLAKMGYGENGWGAPSVIYLSKSYDHEDLHCS